MNARHLAFCESYARYGNATRAAKDAGYSEKTAYSQGHRLLKDVEIQQEISAARSRRFKALHMDADEVLALVAEQARGIMPRLAHITPAGDPYLDPSQVDLSDLAHVKKMSIEDFVDGREVDEEGNTIKRDVRRVTIEVVDPGDARKTLMKHLGLLTEKVEMSVSDSFAEQMARAHARVAKARGEGDEEA